MKFALASYGTRGDIEPCAAVGVELLRRGHDVVMATPPNLIDFIESTGLAAIPYGPNSEQMPEFFRRSWKIQNPLTSVRAAMEHVVQSWAEMSATLKTVAEGADLLFTGVPYQEAAANVAEYFGIPLVAWHHLPMRPNGYLIPVVPPPVIRSTMQLTDWIQWRIIKRAEDSQRRDLGLPKAAAPASRRMAEYGALEIQAYDELCFPGLAAEWGVQRPFVGSLTMALPTDADSEVAAWIAAGTPPIYFGFGSIPVESPAAIIATISAACQQLGERALICSAATDFQDISGDSHVKVVSAVNYATIFPACRAVVHHGGSGTTAAGMRAGVPTLILWSTSDQPIWAAAVRRLKIGFARRFSRLTKETLVADLRRILAPAYVVRAREVATQMVTPADSVTSAADLVEQAAQRCRRG
ncbi:MAG: glycosyltransferase [Mycobacteriaceae bacterium]|nr:glycosyltransferase [Mycobacteriaceae bacterium]